MILTKTKNRFSQCASTSVLLYILLTSLDIYSSLFDVVVVLSIKYSVTVVHSLALFLFIFFFAILSLDHRFFVFSFNVYICRKKVYSRVVAFIFSHYTPLFLYRQNLKHRNRFFFLRLMIKKIRHRNRGTPDQMAHCQELLSAVHPYHEVIYVNE